MKPYILSEVRDADGNTLSITEPVHVRQVISPETSALVREALEKVVGDKNEGTGRNAAVAGYRIGGKTGTSEKVAQNLENDQKEYIVSFIGVAPMDDPRIAVLVLLDTPSSETGIYISGGQMAAPTVGKIFADALPYLGISPQYSQEELKSLSRTVPNTEGLSVDKARQTLQGAELTARVIGEGTHVSAQLPEAGKQIAPGSAVLLYTENAPETDSTSVPELLGMTEKEAVQALAEKNLFLYVQASGASDGVVSAQSISAGSRVQAGAVVGVMLTDPTELGRY